MPLAVFPAGGKLELFDGNPIKLDGFTLHARRVEVVGKPTARQFVDVARFAKATNDSSPWWIGGLIVYSESRSDWKSKLDQIHAATGLSLKTIQNYASLYSRVEEPERLLAPSVGHADVVAALPRPEQTRWLQKARTEGWTKRELREEVKAESRRLIIEGQATVARCDEGQHQWFDKYHSQAFVCRVCGEHGVIVGKAYFENLKQAAGL